MTGDNQCGFRRNRSTTDHIFCIRQTHLKKLEYIKAVDELFIDFKETYDSVRWEVLYNILIQFGIPMKLVRLIKLCLSEVYSTDHVRKHLSDTFSSRNGLRQRDALSSFLFNFAFHYTIRRFRYTRMA
jgi:hypothetical protein